MKFDVILGQKINLEKSELISLGRMDHVEALALELGYRVGELPFTYLVLPLRAPFKVKSM